MEIFGKKLDKNEILKRIGDITQIGEIKHYEFTDGVSKGLRGIDIFCPSGLFMTIVPDRGMDISYLAYKNIPICWRSATNVTSPAYYESRGEEWFRTFFGGLLTTCGLSNTGTSCVDDKKEYGLHGRISNISAEKVNSYGIWENNRYKISTKGKVREASVFGDKLELSRIISVCMDEPRILIQDCVENIGWSNAPILILYHINIGWPVLDISSKLIESSSKVIPVNETFSNKADAQDALKKYFSFSEPIHEYREQCFIHDIKPDSSGYSNIALINKDFDNGRGIGVQVKFNKETLPYLVQWKQMGEGEYVCGLEPSNGIYCREEAKKKKTLVFLEPGEKVFFDFEINILTSNDDIEMFEKNIVS